MTTWFTSDTHFGHTNIIQYCKRQYAGRDLIDMYAMNSMLVEKWNSCVKEGDTVYHLGDFAWDPKTMVWATQRLNGQIHLIRGNHDKRMGKHIEKHFHWIGDYKEIKVDDEELDSRQRIILFHYPIESWNAKHYGSWHLHGHVHGDKHRRTVPTIPGRLDVGVDAWDYYPISYEEIKVFFTRELVGKDK